MFSPRTPIVVNGVVFAVAGGNAGTNAVLYALDPATGKELWTSGTITSAASAGLSAGTGQVYVVTQTTRSGRSASPWQSIKIVGQHEVSLFVACCSSRCRALSFGAGHAAGRRRERSRRCSVRGTCHEAAKATSVKLTREGWIETIDRMKAFGAAGSEDEFAAVLEYLATHFKGDTVRPLDMNTAEAIDLESVLQLLRRESPAVLDTAPNAASSRRSTISKGSIRRSSRKSRRKRIASSS